MHIVELKVENFKRIVAAHIEPQGQMVLLGGDNGAGKTSVLDAIMGALAGGKALPERPLRKGADKGSVEVDLGGVEIRRTFTAGGGSTLRVATKDGANYSRAQEWLDARIGQIACDPLAFMREPAKAQAERLRQIAGIDTAALDAERASLYQQRTDVGRDAKRERGAADSLPSYPDAPDAEVQPEIVQVSAIAAELSEAERTQRGAADAASAAKRSADRSLDVHRAVERLRAELEQAEADLVTARRSAQAAKEAADKARDDAIDPEPIRDRLAGLEQENDRARQEAAAVNRQVQANRRKAEQVSRAEAEEARYSGLTEAIAEVDRRKREMLAAADLPVPGLDLTEDGGVLYQGVPLSQASGAEQIRVSMAVALAGRPEIRVVLIRDASLLDSKSLALVAGVAAEHDAQVWLERVGASDEGAVVIVDGSVRAGKE